MPALLPGLLLVAMAIPAQAITVDSTSAAASLPDACTLRAAIVAANSNQAVGGCVAGMAGPDVITLRRCDLGAVELTGARVFAHGFE